MPELSWNEKEGRLWNEAWDAARRYYAPNADEAGGGTMTNPASPKLPKSFPDDFTGTWKGWEWVNGIAIGPTEERPKPPPRRRSQNEPFDAAPDLGQNETSMTVEEARARKAELIRKVREGTPPLWEPQPGWADNFTDDEIWDAWQRVAANDKLTADPMMVAATLVGDVIDGKHR